MDIGGKLSKCIQCDDDFLFAGYLLKYINFYNKQDTYRKILFFFETLHRYDKESGKPRAFLNTYLLTSCNDDGSCGVSLEAIYRFMFGTQAGRDCLGLDIVVLSEKYRIEFPVSFSTVDHGKKYFKEFVWWYYQYIKSKDNILTSGITRGIEHKHCYDIRRCDVYDAPGSYCIYGRTYCSDRDGIDNHCLLIGHDCIDWAGELQTNCPFFTPSEDAKQKEETE